MPKHKFFTGQPVFNQVLSLIPRSTVAQLSKMHHCDRYCKRFRAQDHLVTMLYCTLHQCNSLREVVTGMQAASARLRHLGLKCTPRRSTLGDANKRRTADFFQDLYHALFQRYYGHLPDSQRSKKLIDRFFIVDSTIISLFPMSCSRRDHMVLMAKKRVGSKPMFF